MVHYVEHGAGVPVLVLHGAGVDHREAEACFEPIFDHSGEYRRIYPDLPGMGRTAATGLNSAEDVLGVLLEFTHRVTDGGRYLLVGHSAGAYFAHAIATREPGRLLGLALVCPLLANSSGAPEHRVVTGSDALGDEGFRRYFVIHTPEMVERYERYVAPGAALADEAALARIGAQWELGGGDRSPYSGPTLVVAGRCDSTVGYAAAVDAFADSAHASLAVLDDTGHALPHEQPHLLAALTTEWLERVVRQRTSAQP